MGWFLLIGLMWLSIFGIAIEKGKRVFLDFRFWAILSGLATLFYLAFA